MQHQTTHIGLLLRAHLERQAMVMLLNSFENYKVTIEAENFAGFQIQLTNKELPHLFIIHYEHFAECKETLQWMTKNYPHIPIVILSAYDADLVLIDLFISGARAFVKKEILTDQFLKALNGVIADGYYYNNPYTKKIFESIYDGKSRLRQLKTLQLTERERCFLQWAGTDLTYREMASKMKISSRAVDKVRNSLFEKLSVKSRQRLSTVALQNRLYPACA